MCRRPDHQTIAIVAKVQVTKSSNRHLKLIAAAPDGSHRHTPSALNNSRGVLPTRAGEWVRTSPNTSCRTNSANSEEAARVGRDSLCPTPRLTSRPPLSVLQQLPLRPRTATKNYFLVHRPASARSLRRIVVSFIIKLYCMLNWNVYLGEDNWTILKALPSWLSR